MAPRKEHDPVNSGEVHEISMQLGQLSQAVKFMTDVWQRQEETASAGRKALHEKFESFKDTVGVQIAGLSLRLDRLVDGMKQFEQTIEKIEPAVKKYEEEKLREEGARRLGKALIAAMTAVAGGIGWGLHELINILWKH
jgi:hypothetical protein